MKYSVEIPEGFLLILSVHGNMGDGETPKLVQMWAKSEVERLGLSKKYRELQEERTKNLSLRLRNILGDDAMNNIELSLNEAVSKLGKTL